MASLDDQCLIRLFFANYRITYSFVSKDDGTSKSMLLEENLLEPVLDMLISKDGFASALAFLEANSWHEECRELLQMWNR